MLKLACENAPILEQEIHPGPSFTGVLLRIFLVSCTWYYTKYMATNVQKCYIYHEELLYSVTGEDDSIDSPRVLLYPGVFMALFVHDMTKRPALTIVPGRF